MGKVEVCMKWLRLLADVFLPRVCAVCGCRLHLRESYLCLHCLADLPLSYFWSGTHNSMADRFNCLMNLHGLDKGESYVHACSLFFFKTDSPYRNILYEIKYKGNVGLGRHMGMMLGSRLASSPAFGDVDVVIPVPLHWRRKWKRGYNQAEAIASGIASALGVPLRTDILKRVRHTETQTKLDVEGKEENVRGAFAAMPAAGPNTSGAVCTGNIAHILLVDDVFTTGSTLYACFTALRAVFPPSVRISVATLGFVSG